MGYRVAVVGATGAVGHEMLNILAEREFPVDEIAASPFGVLAMTSFGASRGQLFEGDPVVGIDADLRRDRLRVGVPRVDLGLGTVTLLAKSVLMWLALAVAKLAPA